MDFCLNQLGSTKSKVTMLSIGGGLVCAVRTYRQRGTILDGFEQIHQRFANERYYEDLD